MEYGVWSMESGVRSQESGVRSQVDVGKHQDTCDSLVIRVWSFVIHCSMVTSLNSFQGSALERPVRRLSLPYSPAFQPFLIATLSNLGGLTPSARRTIVGPLRTQRLHDLLSRVGQVAGCDDVATAGFQHLASFLHVGTFQSNNQIGTRFTNQFISIFTFVV